MKLEVRKAADDTWSWRRRVNGRITAHGADYNSKAGAARGLVDDMISCAQHMLRLDHMSMNAHEEVNLRKTLRKQIEVVA